ncbi:hypothetical protein COY17_04310 [Candidatus Saccharibacteria bacterium CG_4_10_14_0_2_um_filter_52_9]|nr:MAG: hypothetical protein COY17_04310 [Candidatus Saccharibacteria bacterium CG_4_10_14_0_2_um_filter_52_9]
MAAKKTVKEESVTVEKTPNKRLKTKLIVLLAVVIVAVVAGLFVNQVHTNNQLKKENQKLSNPQAAAQAETRTLTQEVGKLIELPSSETPTVATVVDVSKLQKQPFFASAKNGDRVLIFTQAKKAILYRPATNKIIQVAPINLGTGQPQ